MTIFTQSQLESNILSSSLIEQINPSEPINLLCCINDNYVNPMINLMYSIRHFNDSKLKLYILTTSLSADSEELINEKMGYLNIDVYINRVSLPKFTINNQHLSIDTYLKCFAFCYLPSELNKVLYLDADVLCCGSIQDLYNINLENKLLACTFDVDVNHAIVYERRRIYGIKHDYFNAGILLFNLEQMRNKWSKDYIVNLAIENKYQFEDQDLLNSLCSLEDILFFQYQYNFQSWWEIKTPEDLKSFCVAFIHFVSKNKPWLIKNFTDYSTELFYECASLTHLQEYCPGEYFIDRLNKNIEKSKFNKDKIVLFSCFDNGYVKPMINLMFSIRQFNKNAIDLYIIESRISQDMKDYMIEKMANINVSLTFITVGTRQYDTKWPYYWTIDSYLRLFAFKYLPNDISKCIYLDADMIAINDIKKIYDVDVSNVFLAAALDPFRATQKDIIECKIKDNINHEYFSDGLMVYNLDKMRKEWSEEIIDNIIKNTDLIMQDMEVFNIICKENDFIEMPIGYNYYGLLFKDYKQLINGAPIMLHYPGYNYKPWNTTNPLDFHQIFFFKSAKLTGIQEYIKKIEELKI